MLHDWADEYCLTILKNLRVAAGPKTQLLLVEQLIACACDEPATHEIPGAEIPVPPKPLLPNLARAGSMAYNTGTMVRASEKFAFMMFEELTVLCAKDDGLLQRPRTYSHLPS